MPIEYITSFFFYKRTTNIQKSRTDEFLCRSNLRLANELTARCSETNLPLNLLFVSFFHFGGYGHAFLIKGNDCDAIAKGGNRSESDLLHEIDKALRFGRGFLLRQGAFAILA